MIFEDLADNPALLLGLSLTGCGDVTVNTPERTVVEKKVIEKPVIEKEVIKIEKK